MARSTLRSEGSTENSIKQKFGVPRAKVGGHRSALTVWDVSPTDRKERHNGEGSCASTSH